VTVATSPRRARALPLYADRVSVAGPRAAALDWAHDGAHWPHRDASRFVVAGGLRWHVQVMGTGPALLLLHGTGASTHSWRALLPRLARRYTVIAPDLPGHAFTDALPPAALSLPGVAAVLRRLLETLGVAPAAAIGHSAGAAIATRLALDGYAPLRAVVSVNGAFLPFRGVPGWLFPPVARLLALNPWVPQLVAWRAADPRAVARLIASTGSTLDADGVAFYARLMRSPAHAAGVLSMMASWDLAALERDLPRLALPLALIVGAADGTVRPGEAEVVAARAPDADVFTLPGLGHLAHEEAPARVARVALSFLRRHGLDA
jgi:magnesium chelatase accessory protein